MFTFRRSNLRRTELSIIWEPMVTIMPPRIAGLVSAVMDTSLPSAFFSVSSKDFTLFGAEVLSDFDVDGHRAAPFIKSDIKRFDNFRKCGEAAILNQHADKILRNFLEFCLLAQCLHRFGQGVLIVEGGENCLFEIMRFFEHCRKILDVALDLIEGFLIFPPIRSNAFSIAPCDHS